MLAWWVTDWWQINPVILVSWVYWVIFAIILHELAHGWAAIWCGDRTPIESGHMTWNPIVHMGSTSLMLFALFGIAWGQMPIDPTRFRGRFSDALVALAGPAMNLLLAAVCLLLYGVWIGAASGLWFQALSANDVLFGNVQVFLRVGVMLNLALCLFNLLPVPPLDGSRIAANFIPAYRRAMQSEQAQYAALAVFVLLFMFGGRHIFRTAMKVTIQATDVVERIVDSSTSR